MSSRQEVQSKLRVTTVKGEPTLVTRRSQAKFTVAGSTVMSNEVTLSNEAPDSPSAPMDVTSGYLVVQSDTATVVPDSAAPYSPCSLERGVITQVPAGSEGLEGRYALYLKAKAIKYDSVLLVPWDAVLLLI